METPCVQSDLNAVALWLCSSQMCLYVVKFNAMLIGSRQRIMGKTLKVSIVGTYSLNNFVQYLGVLIDHGH